MFGGSRLNDATVRLPDHHDSSSLRPEARNHRLRYTLGNARLTSKSGSSTSRISPFLRLCDVLKPVKTVLRSRRGLFGLVLACLSLTLILLKSPHSSSNQGGRLGTADLKTSEVDFLQEWLQFQSKHPIIVEDRLSFAQMGLRTAVYEHAIRDHERISDPELARMENSLYPWIRDLDVIRNRHIDRASAARLNGTAADAQSHPSSRGIIIVAGEGQFMYATQLIATIREAHRCDLPIEVFYYGAEDLRSEKREFLITTYRNVRTVDLAAFGHFDESFAHLDHGTWAMKPYAMLATNFTEVMLLDADSILLAHPYDFFEEAGYKETGTLFFHDRLVKTEKYDIIHIFLQEQLGQRGPSPLLRDSPFWELGLRHRQESGLVLLNKAKPSVFAALLFVMWQNAGPIRDAATYHIFYGDKETFWIAFELSGMPHHFSPYFAGAVGPERAVHLDGFCSDHILHFFDAPFKLFDPSAPDRSQASAGENRPAWLNGALRKNKLWDPDDSVMEMQSSIWSLDGTWDWRPVVDGGMSFCMINYTRSTMEELNLGPILPAILEAGRHANRIISDHLDEE